MRRLLNWLFDILSLGIHLNLTSPSIGTGIKFYKRWTVSWQRIWLESWSCLPSRCMTVPCIHISNCSPFQAFCVSTVYIRYFSSNHFLSLFSESSRRYLMSYKLHALVYFKLIQLIFEKSCRSTEKWSRKHKVFITSHPTTYTVSPIINMLH